MTSPSMVHRSGDTLVVRSVVSGNQLFVNGHEPEKYVKDTIGYIDSDEYFDPDDNKNLPECKIRRNYSCIGCRFFTQNPRHYLHHLRDVHKEKVKIYECSNCLYASRHFQKLLRHMKMMHGNLNTRDVMESLQRQKARRKRKRPSDEDDVDPEPSEDEADGDVQNANDTGDTMESSNVSKTQTDLKCSLCPFTTKHQGQLTRHEKQEHIKTKFFRCSKCNYVTHIKARFTKHVKYHSMPMIKCDLCDFRTPYKWNLDRHYKNHNGHGVFRCSACNFTTDIKQSLTVHEMNHHVPPVGQAAGLGVGRRRNKVGASDTTAAEEAAAAAAQTATIATDSNAIISQHQDFAQITMSEKQESGIDTSRKSPKIKISFKKLKTTSTQEQNERHNFDTDFIHPDDIIHHSNGNIYIKNKCKLCNFKTAWDTEMAKHEQKVHNIVRDGSQQNSVAVKKTPRPIPNLIPIQSSQSSQAMSASALLKIPHVQNRSTSVHGHFPPKTDDYLSSTDVMSQKDINDMCAKSANSSLRDFASLFGDDVVFENEKSTSVPVASVDVPEPKTLTVIGPQPQTSSALFKKKNASFFDKLKEKLMTGESCNLTCKWCGHQSKCLTESAAHQKTCGRQQSCVSSLPASAPSTNSTRCQHCRQRCKSSIDLHNHLQVCSEANKQLQNDTFGYNFEKPDITIKLEDDHTADDSLEPHPMENVVFVWNNISPQLPDVDEPNLSERLEDNSLDLTVRVQSPESEGSFMECENINISSPVKMPTHGNDIDMVAEGRRVFKCPHCSFWATTASRFHVHIVGHLNKKPFECSLCAYRSNWRWDITKHIRLKSVRDPQHEKARVLMTDETGRRNYSKYNKYLTQLRSTDSPQENSLPGRRSKSNYETNQGKTFPNTMKSTLELPKLTRAPTNTDFQAASRNNPLRPPPPLKAANEMYLHSFNEQKKRRSSSDFKKTLFKCKKCNFRDASRDNILLHVKGHYRQESHVAGNAEIDEASVSRGQAPFRCGHCHQVSNWKHVIQRHCRLKHSGDVRVVIGGRKGSDKIEVDDQSDEPDHMDVIQTGVFKCKECPYSVNSQTEFDNHLEMHIPKSNSAMKCYFCSYYVAQKFELFDHLKLHGVTNPEDYVNRAMQGREMSPTDSLYKRYKCVLCPYVSNSKSQFSYHKQFHKYRGGPFKCDYCSYSVTRRHLLQQHMKVHGINIPVQKTFRSGSDRDSDALDSEDFAVDEFEEVMSSSDILNSTTEEQYLLDVPLVWVSREDKFSKMYKCRYCPHLNMRKVNIQEHEKMHSLREKNPNSSGSDEHYCTECSYVCNNAGVLSSHLKVHQNIYGQIHCLVDTSKSDEEQISELTRLLNASNANNSLTTDKDESTKSEQLNSVDDQEKNLLDFTIIDDQSSVKMLFFCEHCPARFLNEKEYNIHSKFHGIRLFYRCEYCTYAARQRPHLLSHSKVHSDEYQENTRHYQFEYPVSESHPPPRTAVIVDAPGNNNEPIWVVISGTKNEIIEEIETSNIKVKNGRQSNKNFVCKKCPARFFKNDLLQYHMTLHGCKNPYKCKFCDYAARTSSNLRKHIRIHGQRNTQVFVKPASAPTKIVPLSGTDLFQQKSEAEKLSIENQSANSLSNIPSHIDSQFETLANGNPKFVYPTYLKNGRMKEKRYKCHKCPSAFEKREQYKVHLSLHGSKQRYKCENCDYSVKYYANYVQHTRKHNENALAVKKTDGLEECENEEEPIWKEESSENGLSPPFNKLAIKTLNSSVNRGPLKLSFADRQTLMILQQRRASNASSTKDSSMEEKKMFWCPHCPYTSYRRDAVDNHVNRHICVSGVRNNYTCDHCDYTVPQSHFLREHVKIHFTGQKTHSPEGYMVCNNLQLSTKNMEDPNDLKTNENNVIFQDCGQSQIENSRFQPTIESNTPDDDNKSDVVKIFINPENGEFVENCGSVKSDTKETKKSV